MKSKLIKLLVMASVAVSICSPSLAADAKASKEVEAAERIKQTGRELREDIQRIREVRIRLIEDQKRMQIEEAAERKREAVARAEESRKNAAALAEARRGSEQKARALLAEQEKTKLEAHAKAAQTERDRQALLATRLAKLESEEKLVKERAAKFEATKFEFDPACMDDPDPNCAAKNKARRAQRAQTGR